MPSFRSAALAAAFCLIGASAVQAAPEKYEIDPAHASVGFLTMHIGYAKTLGMFLETSGSFAYDEDAQTLSDVTITVQTDSVFTNHDKRDQHLRSPDFLNSREFPEMTFVGKEAEKLSDTTGRLHGELTLLGQTHPLTLDLTLNKTGQYPFGDNYVVGVSARGTVKRSEYGMMYAVENGWVGDEIELIIEIEAIRE